MSEVWTPDEIEKEARIRRDSQRSSLLHEVTHCQARLSSVAEQLVRSGCFPRIEVRTLLSGHTQEAELLDFSLRKFGKWPLTPFVDNTGEIWFYHITGTGSNKKIFVPRIKQASDLALIRYTPRVLARMAEVLRSKG